LENNHNLKAYTVYLIAVIRKRAKVRQCYNLSFRSEYFIEKLCTSRKRTMSDIHLRIFK